MLMKLPHLQGADLYSLKPEISQAVIPRPALGTMGRTVHMGSKILKEVRGEQEKEMEQRIFLFANSTAKLINSFNKRTPGIRSRNVFKLYFG